MFPKRKIVALLGSVLFVSSVISACTGDDKASEGSETPSTTTGEETNTPSAEETPAPPEEVTLEFYMPSPVSEVTDMQAVLDKFYEETKDTLNTKIHFNFTTFDDIGQKVSLKLAAGEQVDSIFTAPWTSPNINQQISQGQLLNLDSYFNNDKYPGLKKAFTQEYLKNNSFADSTGTSHIYGIPFTHGFNSGSVIYYRKDLAEKYGIGEITSYDDLVAFYDAIVKNEKGIVPLSLNGSNINLASILSEMKTTEASYRIQSGVAPFTNAVVFEGSKDVYIPKTMNPWNDPEFVKLAKSPPAEDPLWYYAAAVDWYNKGYIEKDVLAQKDPDGQFMAGKAASVYRSLDIYSTQSQQLEAAIPGAKLGYFITNQFLRDEKPKMMGSDFKAWNFAAIPANSKNADRTMAFFDWLFSSQENHDLFEFGIEGKHWNAIGDSKYEVPAGLDSTQTYNFPAYTLTWNPTMVRYDSKTPDDVVRKLNLLGDTNFFYSLPASGFSFVSDNVTNELAKISDVASKMHPIGFGLVPDYKTALDQLQEDLDKAGYQKLVAELQKQFSDYLSQNPYEY